MNEEIKNKFNIALLQISPTGDIKRNIEKGIKYCKKAKENGADIAVFPEMWSNGYEHIFSGYLKDQKQLDVKKVEEWKSKEIDENSVFLQSFKKTAKELEMAIAITYLEKHSPLPKNTVAIIDKNGNIILKYSKVHTVDFKMEAYTEPGDGFKTCELDYGKEKVKIGTMICYDRDFPESARILMLQGAEIILVPNACRMKDIILYEQRVRAYENMVGIVTVNYPGEGYKGGSSVYSPIVIDKEGNEVSSEMLVMGTKEEMKVVSFDMDELREYRENKYCGNAYRKPYAYKEITNNNVNYPFIRKDSRR